MHNVHSCCLTFPQGDVATCVCVCIYVHVKHVCRLDVCVQNKNCVQNEVYTSSLAGERLRWQVSTKGLEAQLATNLGYSQNFCCDASQHGRLIVYCRLGWGAIKMAGEHCGLGGAAGSPAWGRCPGQCLHELRWAIPQSVQGGPG